jgi:uracil permease
MFLFTLAFFQKPLALLTSIPAPVIGAVMVVAMAAQVGAGINVLTQSESPLTPRDYMVIGIPLLMGGIVSILPEAFFLPIPTALNALLKNGLVVGVVLVLLLEHVLLPAKPSGS